MTAKTQPKFAILMIVCASAIFGATTLLAKTLGSDLLGEALHPLQISHGRFLFAFIAISACVLVMRPKFSRPNLKLHLARTILGWSGISLMFAAVTFIPVSDAVAISFLNPVFTMALAIPLLGEKVGPIRWFASAIALIGALVLLRPGADTFQPAALIALAAAMAMGFEIVFIKKLSGAEPPLQILFVNNAIGLSIATLAVLLVWAKPSVSQWVALAAIGFLMAMGQALFVNAMSSADASLLVPFSYVTLIFATFYDLVIFKVFPDQISLLGAAIIISGALLLAVREATRRK